MGRWQPNIRGKLQESALALYMERGFDQTTAAEIAKRAGVTERTFFRHFADKREVLFGESAILKEHILASALKVSLTDGPLDAVSQVLIGTANMLDVNRKDLLRQRYAVISANPELAERELAKLAEYGEGVSKVFRERGVNECQSILAAEMGMTLFRIAVQQWLDGDDTETLVAVLYKLFEELKAVVRYS